jgi:hypothetical protein
MRDDSPEKYQQRLAEAKRVFGDATRAAEDAHRRAQFAENAVSEFIFSNELRRDAAHEGVDRAVENARASLPLNFLEMRRMLCSQQPADLSRLAALFVAGSAELQAHLHELVDEPAAKGRTAWSEFDQAGVDAERARLRVPLAQARSAETEAKDALQLASQHLTDLELGRA